MSSIKIELPESLGIEPQDFLLAAASKLSETGKISSGQGASIVGVSKRTFLELLEVYGVSLFNTSESIWMMMLKMRAIMLAKIYKISRIVTQ
ncbi:UPF0175 family protein [Mongoliitalea daihaiensis]|uniref:UPF0175 family protein n=1 Tax=Mongoliitalea daihaiensis TaxID=2782006 RepID=UPI001F353B6C|nr:UPF0175 family protein [Mongoliitalea daihaiensis]UJP65884.1 UPF0175 family protein [Mongoliitalea daihaiensis]